jgi:hypothetical protein
VIVIGFATVLFATSGGTSVYVQRFLAYIGLREYKRIFQFRPGGTRPVFTSDPSRQVEYVDVMQGGGLGVGDGPGETWTTDYHSGGIIGFADGSAVSVSQLSLRGDKTGTKEVSN